jgi:hypothetical protein
MYIRDGIWKINGEIGKSKQNRAGNKSKAAEENRCSNQ